jgi:hypothetical protein
MKKTYQYIALAALALSLAACSQEDDFIPQGNQKGAPITIASVGVANLATRATIEDDKLVEGNIGVTITSTGNDDRYKGSNVRWYGSNGVWGLVENQKVVLYEGNGESQKIYAYYPYAKDIIEGTENLPVTLPEAFDSNFEGYDYLCTKEGISLSQNPVSLTLSHAFSKVSVSVNMMGTELEGDMVTEIALDNVPHNGERSATTGAIDPDKYGPANGRIALYGYDDEDYDEVADYYIGYALPNATTTLDLRVTMQSGRIFTAKAPISGGMTDGVHYLISMKVGKDAVTVSDVSVQPWGNGGTLESGVAEEKFLSIDGTVYNSASELQDAVKNNLSQEGVTSVTINGYLSEELHKAVISAIGEVKTVGAVTNGYLWEGSVTYTVYEDFTNATATWTDGMTLTMLGDATDLTKYIKTTAKGLVLDLNGHTLASSATLCTIWIDGDSSSELTIRDTKGGGYVQGTVYAVYSPSGTSKLCLESGTVERVDANGDFTMTGGTIRNENGNALNTSSDKVKIVVSGGEIYSSKYAIYSYTVANIVVTGTAKLTGVKGIIDDRGVSNFTVTGGIFSHDPSQWVNLNAYTVTENSDGTWSVTAKE